MYNLNTIDNHFYILLTLQKIIIRILLGIKCKLFIFKKKIIVKHIFFFTIHLF